MIYWVLLYLLIVGSMLYVIFIIGFPDIVYDILGFAVSPDCWFNALCNIYYWVS